MTVAEPPKRDFAQELAEKFKIIVPQIKPGEFVLGFDRGGGDMTPYNPVSDHFHTMGNYWNLWAAAQLKGYQSAQFASPKQWAKVGGRVKDEFRDEKGKIDHLHGELIQYVDKWVPKDKRTGDPEKDAREIIPFVKTYTLFNRDQVDGLPELILPERPPLEVSLPEAEAYLRNVQNLLEYTMEEKGRQAYYQFRRHHIQLPDEWRYKNTKYYSREENRIATWAHESMHAMAKHLGIPEGWGDGLEEDSRRSYAAHEVFADAGAGTVCRRLNLGGDRYIDPKIDPDRNHAAYIAGWNKALEDPKIFLEALRMAGKAFAEMEKAQPPHVRERSSNVIQLPKKPELVDVGGVKATPATAEKIEQTLTLTQDVVPDELKPKPTWRERVGNREGGNVHKILKDRSEARQRGEEVPEDPFLLPGHNIDAQKLSYSKKDIER